jgi:hypothetical protein
MNKIKFFSLFLLYVCFSYLFSSCNQNSPVTASNPNASVSSMADLTGPPFSNTTISVNNAKFLIEFIKLETARGSDDGDIKEGPFVVNINLNGTVTVIALNNLPVNTYREVHFKIHKHTPNEPVIDPDFGTTGVGYSGIISGVYLGVPFIYRSSITASQEVDIEPPLIVLGATAIPSVIPNVTLTVNPKLWFRDSNGQLLNPTDEANIQQIDNNIKDSFRQAFEDDDHDGHPNRHGH